MSLRHILALFTQLVHAQSEELNFLNELLCGPHEMVVFGFPEKVVEAEPASNDQREALVQFGGKLKNLLIEVLQSESLRGLVHEHLRLLLVEELPYLINDAQVVPRHFMELSFRGIQLLLVLGLHHFQVEF